MLQIFKEFLHKLKESSISVLPFFAIILALFVIFLPFNLWAFVAIIFATLLMIVGMSLFNVGVDMSTMKMGGLVGSNLSKSRRFSFMLILSFLLGFIITIAEPDLMVLAEQVPGISSKWIILLSVAGGSGIFLIISTIRTLFRLSIKTVLIASYVLALGMCLFANPSFIALSYDSIGITTGAVSAPFIMAFGLGICAVRSGKNNQEDGFGLIALASIGPVLSMMIVSMFINSNADIASQPISTVTTLNEFGSSFGTSFLSYCQEVFVVILPIFLFFLIYNHKYLKLPKTTLVRMFVGLLYTYIGLILFLSGVNSGYLPTANLLGFTITESAFSWTLLPISVIIGFFLIFAEPAVHILNKQVEDITEGVITKKAMLIALSIGVALSMLLAICRALFHIEFVYIILPLTVILVILSKIAPNMFVSIAFDSGGVASGSLAASFVLPFVIGVCKSLNLSVLEYAFGTIALIALIPTIVIEIMGIRYQYVINKTKKKERIVRTVTIVEFE